MIHFQQENFTLRHSELRDTLLPLLREQVFHVTPHDRFALIEKAGYIRTNSDGALGNMWDRSATSFARQMGFLCLVDLCNKSDEVINLGLSNYYFFTPHGDDVVLLILSSESYPQVLRWEDVKSQAGSAGVHREPYLECWYPTDLPLSFVQRALFVRVLQTESTFSMLTREHIEPGKAT
jgi:hypothetical protein